MALTITMGELAAAVRLSTDPTTGPHEPYLTDLTRLLAVADGMITRYAPDAPDADKNEAAIRIVGYLLNAPPYTNNINVSTPVNVLRNSHAQSILADSRVLSYAKVE